MAKFKLKSIKAGFGVTILPKEPGGNVLKYYLEPEIEMEVPGEADSDEELQKLIDDVGNDILGMIQQTVKKKAKADHIKKKEWFAMGRQGNKYEPTVAFIVIAFGKVPEEDFVVDEDADPEAIVERHRFYLQDDFELPISKKIYKATLKNVEVFVDEFMQAHPDIESVRLDRISHIKVYER